MVAAKTLEGAAALREELAAQGYTAARLQAQRKMLRDLLLQQGMTTAEGTRMLNALMGPDTSLSGAQRDDAEKTDPVLQIKDRL